MIIPSGYAQANWKFTGSALPFGAEITLGLNVSGAGSDPSAVASTCIIAWVDNIQAVTPPSITLASCLVKYGPNNTGAAAEVASGAAGAGSGTVQTPNTAYLIRKLTTAGGRAGRGRFFYPGVTEANVNDAGIIDSTPLGILQGVWDDFLADLTAADLFPVLLHSAGSPISGPNTITALQVDNRVATQRRRLRG